MSDENKPLHNADSKKKVVVDLIWNRLDCDSVLPEHITECSGVNALTVCNQLIPAHDSSAGPMPIGSAYCIQENLRSLEVEFRIYRAAHYMSESVISAMLQTWVKIILSFLVLYTNCKRPRTERALNSRIKAIFNNN